MELLLENRALKVEAAAINDVVNFEGATLIVHDERAAIAKSGEVHKCVFSDISHAADYFKKYGVSGKVCLMNAPLDAPEVFGFEAEACKTFAYLSPMPPLPDKSVTIKRLAPSLAETVRSEYAKSGAAGYTVEQVAELMRTKGVFGAIVDGKLAGFIGRHSDGNMGMLEVYESFRRRGLGVILMKFMMGYIMTFGRTPVCDVFIKNEPSIALQRGLGMTETNGYTFWGTLGSKL